MSKRLTSADIEDGKVVFDKATQSSTLYKKIPKGYQMIITTPQPNGTNKTETKTFYDPVPMTAEELQAARNAKEGTTTKGNETTVVRKIEGGRELVTTITKADGSQSKLTQTIYDPVPMTVEEMQAARNAKEGTTTKGNETTVVKKIPGGREVITTVNRADGTQSKLTQTIYDAEEEEITETTESHYIQPTRKTTQIVSQMPQTTTALVPSESTKISTREQTRTDQVKIRSFRTYEEIRRVTETTEITGTSTSSSSKKNEFFEQKNVLAIEDFKSDKKNTQPAQPRLQQQQPQQIVQKPAQRTIDSRTKISRKTTEEEVTDEETIEFRQEERKETQQNKNVTQTKKTHTETACARLTSADIEDGKVVFDKATQSSTLYKKIPKGYEMIITTPQPNGTNKTETKTFYDPVPMTAEEIEAAKNVKGKKTTKGNETTVVRKIPGGHEEITTVINADGTQSVRVQTIYDAEEEEITETTESQVIQPTKKKTTKVVSQKVPGGTAFVPEGSRQISTQEQSRTDEFKVKSHKTVEETRRVTETTEISGKSTSKKSKVPQGPPLPPDFSQKPGETTTVEKKKVKGGTEYIYTTELADGRTQVARKTVEKEKGIEMTDEEIAEYKKQLKEAEKHKNIKKTKKIQTETGTKTIIPSENEGEVTTMETIPIDGGTEYHYTTIKADGTVKKSSKTVYDPVPVSGDEEEVEEIEEYEEEIIEPGETITETREVIKTLTPADKKKLGQDANSSNGTETKKKGGKKSAKQQ